MPAIYYTYYEPIPGPAVANNRLEHALGRNLLRNGLEDLYHIRVSIDDLDAMLSEDDNGKPYLPDHRDIFFNITHCSSLVACAFDEAPIGIDAEKSGYFPEVLIKRALSDNEQNYLLSCSIDEAARQETFWRFWTLKEAYVKRSGIGVDTDLTAFSFMLDQPCQSTSPLCHDSHIMLPVHCSDPYVSCYQTMLERGHIVSLCTGHREDESLIVCDVIENIDLCESIYDKNNCEDYPHR